MNNSVAPSDALFCPVCHNPFSNPHSLPCGHTFCLHPCLMATKGAGGKLVCQTCNSSCEFCELTSERKVSEKVASFKRAHETLRDATCKGCRIVYSECRLCNHCNDYLCETCSRAHSEIYSSILLSRLISLRMRYRRLLRYAEKDEYRQDSEVMGSINRYKATIESALSRAEVCVESLDAVLSENMENVFPDSSTNAPKQQESGDFWSVRQVDEVISSGGQVVMEFPPSFRLPSDGVTAQNSSIIHPLYSQPSENKQNGFPHSSTNALEDNGCVLSAPQVDEVISSGGEVVKERPPNFRLPSRNETAQNTSITRPLDAQLSEKKQSGFPDSSMNAGEENSDFSVVRQVDEVINSGGEVVMGLPSCSYLPSPSETTQNSSISQSEPKETSEIGKPWRSAHTAIMFTLSKCWIDFSCHQEALNALREPLQQLGDRIVRVYATRKFPTGQLPQEDASQTEVTSNKVHTAISFELVRNKSKNLRPSNDAILGHFRHFGNVVQFHCYSCAQGYVDYSCHEEALSALNESIQELEGWLVKPHPVETYPQGLTELANTFTALYFQLSMSTPKRKPPSEEDLKEHLSRFGRITHFQYLLNPPRGYVEYSSHSEAKKALSEPIHEVGTCILHSHPIKEFPGVYLQPDNTEIPPTPREVGNTSNAVSTLSEGIRFTTPSPPSTETEDCVDKVAMEAIYEPPVTYRRFVADFRGGSHSVLGS